ncbi:hypothetical protein [Cellulomonas alba]|uniref:ABC transporter permease n=1 Tax=Cellulomonas alba TaxID=3053467 RepID=A0ABT7SBB3_9CELL|nr:hypothetical protein [Cellulomonas alba]MDM7853426.1 hypothetical protein [Cellulomonas alba]
MPSPLPVDRVVARRRLLWAWVVTLLATGELAGRIAFLQPYARSDDPFTHATAAWIFFWLALETILLVTVVVWQWRRWLAVRPVVLPVDATRAVAAGVPELDEPSGAHLGLSGQVDPPPRW